MIQAQLHRANLDSVETSHEMVALGEPGESIGAMALTTDPDVLLVCAKYGLAKANFKTKEIRYFFKYPLAESEKKRLRSNDGIVDPWGNLWIGLMSDFPVTKKEGVKMEGKLLRVDAKTLDVKVMVDKTGIANGLFFSEDRTKLYWTDSITSTLWLFDYNHDKVELLNRQPCVDYNRWYKGDLPEPDGLAATANGHVFHAVYGHHEVVEYDLETKDVVSRISIPAKRPTCVCVGGPNDDEVFVTTAHPLIDSQDFDVDVDGDDQGGYVYRVKLNRKLHGQQKNVWGGK